jgi:predicted  nucleic acid-binding Zn-ribbon protein
MHPAIQKLVEMDRLLASDAAAAAALRVAIPPELLAHYDRLKVRGKKGVAPVINLVCQSCFLRLSSGAAANLQDKADVHLCENCGCYIYPVRPSPLPSASASPPPRMRVRGQPKSRSSRVPH